ncbi:MAG: 3-coathanger stack domain-containing protein, partial [bacterium]
MMKKIILIFILITPIVCSAQSADLLKKYWYYRFRLKNDFLKVGPNPGESIPAETRHISGANNGKIRWGDATMHLGWYIGVLATEYRLLDDNNQNTLPTKEELYYALNAFERLDINAEPLYGGNQEAPNGFFIRDDVPADFLTKNNNENLAHFNQELTCTTIVNGVTSDYILEEEHPSDPKHAEMSHDQVYHLLIGFALVKRFVDDWVTYNGVALRQKAIDMADNIIEYLKADSWITRNAVTGNTVHRGPHGAVLRSYGIAVAGHKITGEWWYQNNTSIANYFSWQLVQTFKNPTSYNNHHKAALAAIGDSWQKQPDGTIPPAPGLPCYNSTYQGLQITTGWADWDPFYFTLWALLNNKNQTLPSPLSHLNGAPREGPYAYVNDKAGYGWASDNRYMKAPDVQYGGPGSGNEGDFNGLDYMLMYNLYHLKYRNNPYLNLPFYTNLMDRIETLNFPYLLSNRYYGSQSHYIKASYDRFRSITSNKTIEPDGWLVYRAGQEISLEPPFEVKEGAEFNAYVQPFECSESGNYKSLADTTQTDSTLAGNDLRDATNSLYGMHDPLPLKNKVIPLTYNEEEDIYPEYETMDT